MSASIVVLIAMTVVVAMLAVYRQVVARKEDDFVHIADPTGQLVANQQKLAHTLSLLDRMGIGLTVATALYAVGLLGAYVISVLRASGRI